MILQLRTRCCTPGVRRHHYPSTAEVKRPTNSRRLYPPVHFYSSYYPYAYTGSKGKEEEAYTQLQAETRLPP